MKKAVLFDLDGTLVNSLEDLRDALNYTLNKFGYDKRSLEEVNSFVGNGIDMLIKRGMGNREFDFDSAMKYFREYYNKNLCNKTKPYYKIDEVLKELKEKDFKLGVVTNKAQESAEMIVEYFFKNIFDVVVGADLEKRKKKPDCEPIDFACNILGVKREDCIYIGDSEVDIETSKNAKIDFIGVAWGFRDIGIFENGTNIALNTQDIISLCCNFL